MYCSPLKMFGIINQLTDMQKQAVVDMGLEGILHIPKIQMRRYLCYWLMMKINIKEQSIRIRDNEIHITEKDAYYLMGLRDEGDTILLLENSYVYPDLLKCYTEPSTNTITVTHLIRYIKSCKDAGDHFKRSFLLLLLRLVIAPTNDKDYIPHNYLSILTDVENISSLNWARFTLDFLFSSIDKQRTKNTKYVSGCMLLLQVIFIHMYKFCFPRI